MTAALQISSRVAQSTFRVRCEYLQSTFGVYHLNMPAMLRRVEQVRVGGPTSHGGRHLG